MTDEPDYIDRARHRELSGRTRARWGRRAVLVVLLAFVVAGLANVFGQRATTSVAQGPDVRLQVRAPERLRGGLLYQARFQVRAATAIAKPTIVLERGWLEGMTINTIEPQPVQESSDGRRLVLQLQPLRPGHVDILYMQFQVNPTTVGRRSQQVRLTDGSRTLLVVHRTVTVFF